MRADHPFRRAAPGAPPLAPKGFVAGTHRFRSPEETLARVSRLFPVMGITRVANVTGLDTIGIPAVMVVRPNSRSLSVSQGKALDLLAAKVSGVMESTELYHAETMRLPLLLASADELRFTHRLVDVTRLPRLETSAFHPGLPILWVQGWELLSDEPIWVPYEMVHTNYTVPPPTGTGCFPTTSSGLASGNHALEALSHALCEVVEHDAKTLWSLGEPLEGPPTRVDLDTVEDPDCAECLRRYAEAGLAVGVWDMTTDVGIPAYCCTVIEQSHDLLAMAYSARGAGCHPSRDIALLRALTEAAQDRLTFISGARDDLTRRDYDLAHDPRMLARRRDVLESEAAGRDLRVAPTYATGSFDEDVSWELDRLRAVGIDEVVVVDLSRPEFDIAVVRVVVPGLEGPAEHLPSYLLGERGMAVFDAHQRASA